MANPAIKTDRLGGALRRYSDLFLGLGVIGLLVTLVTPMPPWMLDLMLAANMTAGVLLLMVTMNARSSTELSTFPTILLFSTLCRLGLNVASTRLILSGGEAGSVISAFGEYVGGDNLAVGLVVFLILIIIQFVVITKGSGRISEVAARFVLDAMPGKQMAIDADLNAGLIDSEEAKRRRVEIGAEAEFYGAMDGASKFVRGDAIAGLIITALNLVGGVTIGTMAGMGIGDAVDTYSKLTIGDGLVSQIPALFISTAAGVLVTKDTGESSLGPKLLGQIGGRPKATLIAAGTMFMIGLLPGMPKLPFFLLATVLAVLWNSTRQAAAQAEQMAAKQPEPEVDPKAREEEEVSELLRVDRVGLEIGYRLIPLVDDKAGGGILDHVAQLRRRFALRHGVVLPPVRIKDNIKLPPRTYRLTIGGQEVAGGEIHPGRFLAMDSGGASGKLQGDQTVDPAFGLPAWWIDENRRDEAEVMGYTVIDPTSVLVTHLSETLRDTLGELLTRDDVKDLVEAAKEVSPSVVAELIPDKMSYGDVQQVLRNLLAEDVPIRNMSAILEALADNIGRSKDVDTLTELVRQRLARALCEQHGSAGGTVRAITLDPDVELRLAAAVGATDSDAAPVNPAWLQSLMVQVGEQIAQATQAGLDVVLLVRSNVRRFVGELVRSSLPKVAVLSYNEVIPARAVETVAVVKMED
ncbi:MAG: flagellar biosynthesis protein FlhA [Planctomycetota bacterium]|nr:flagellar biosynthesis protein FlhA [Planctomycetota bacterium]